MPTRPIIPSSPAGANACIMHYRDNDQRLCDGDLLLLDAGCEHDYYASDIARTFPSTAASPRRSAPSTRWCSRRSRRDRQGARRQPLEPAARGGGAHHHAGTGQNSVCSGAGDAAHQGRRLLPFFGHRTGHWLGLDVHDVGRLQSGRRVARAGAGHGAHGRAGHLHPAPPRRYRGNSGTSACASRTTCWLPPGRRRRC